MPRCWTETSSVSRGEGHAGTEVATAHAPSHAEGLSTIGTKLLR